MFLKAINENHTTIVSTIESVPFQEEVMHPIDFLHAVYNAYLLIPIYTYVNDKELEVIKQWLGDLYV